MIRRILVAALVIGAGLTASWANAATITTLFATNNGGAPGGAVYFDVTLAGNAIDITGFTTNTGELDAFTWTVYLTAAGTSAFGNETNAGAWTSVSTGSGTGQGVDLETAVTLDNPFTLLVNTTYGMALVFGGTVGHDYTNGDGANQSYSNGDVALSFGSATNSPFTAGVFEPRVWKAASLTTSPTCPSRHQCCC